MTNNEMKSDILVVGAGIAGITAAVEAAETGKKSLYRRKGYTVQ